MYLRDKNFYSKFTQNKGSSKGTWLGCMVLGHHTSWHTLTAGVSHHICKGPVYLQVLRPNIQDHTWFCLLNYLVSVFKQLMMDASQCGLCEVQTSVLVCSDQAGVVVGSRLPRMRRKMQSLYRSLEQLRSSWYHCLAQLKKLRIQNLPFHLINICN